MKRLLGLAIAVWALSSCTIKQEYQFAEGFGGRYVMEVDMSEMMAFMGEEGEENMILQDVNVDSVVRELNAKEGVSKAFMVEKDGVMRLGYTFRDLATLNRQQAHDPLTEEVEAEMFKPKSHEDLFVLNGKTMHYYPPILDSAGMEPESREMSSMLQYQVQCAFAKTIKKVDNDSWVVQPDKKSMKLELSGEALISGESGQTSLKLR